MRSGLIPARAGNTRTRREVANGPWAHPRSRGEHVTAICILMMAPGSSPLARGTLPHNKKLWDQLGLIPARAGNTTPTMRAFSPWRAHPRSRGEHLSAASTMRDAMGSSPLARGTPRGRSQCIQLKGLIPARAGNTHQYHSASVPRRAHPRSRGEHAEIAASEFERRGSSPLARGTLST